MNKDIAFVHGEYFNGDKISDYGIKSGYVDYRCFTKNLNMVLNNDIMATLENNGYYFELVNYPDYSAEINELQEQINDYESKIDELDSFLDNEEYTLEKWQNIRKEISDYESKIDELQDQINDYENYEYPEIFQYFIVDDNAAKIIKDYTNDPLFYCESLDVYIYGITHYGTSWDYVLTDIPCNVPYEN